MSGTLKRTVQDAFDEPACATNRAKSATARKAGCAKPLTPGAAAGGCAFDGAMITLQPIVDVAHLVHAPLACGGNSWDNRGSASSGSMLYKTGFTTDLTELDIVMGRGERKLYRAIGEIVEAHAPPAVFVYATCVTAMTGDDIVAVCKAAAQAFATPVIPVEVPGFAGSKNLGCKLAGEMMFRHVIGTREPAHTTDTDINIIGDYNLSGELWQVKPLLDRLGIRILGSLSADARYRQVAQMHRARVTMLVCSHALQGLARKLEETYDIPYFEGSFYGISDTSAALRSLCALLVKRGASADLLDRCEALIAEEEAKVRAALEPYRARVTGKRVLLYTGGHKTWSIVSALQELGVEVVGTSVRKATDNDKARVIQVMGTEAHMYENMAPRDMYATLKASGADILMSGARSQFVALKARTAWIDVNQEKHEPYAGYMGMVDLVRAIDRSVNNPMWAQLHRPAPWETTRPAAPGLGAAEGADGPGAPQANDCASGQDRLAPGEPADTANPADPADPASDFEDC